jgi:hypothetical protein
LHIEKEERLVLPDRSADRAAKLVAVQIGHLLPCHMPRSSPMPFLEFTDHRIRIVRAAQSFQTMSWGPVENALVAGDFNGARRLLAVR